MNVLAQKKAKAASALSLEKFNTAKRALNAFLDENEEMMDMFFELVAAYNAATTAMRDNMRHLPKTERHQYGAFRIAASKKAYRYDPARLSARVLRQPGVIKTIDKNAVESLLEEGKITEAELDAAKEEYDTSPALRGPKEVELKFEL